MAGVRVDTFEREGKKASNVTITYRFAEPSTFNSELRGHGLRAAISVNLAGKVSVSRARNGDNSILDWLTQNPLLSGG